MQNIGIFLIKPGELKSTIHFNFIKYHIKKKRFVGILQSGKANVVYAFVAFICCLLVVYLLVSHELGPESSQSILKQSSKTTVNFEYISNLVVVFLFLTWNMY